MNSVLSCFIGALFVCSLSVVGKLENDQCGTAVEAKLAWSSCFHDYPFAGVACDIVPEVPDVSGQNYANFQ